MANDVRIIVLGHDQIQLTDIRPHLERYWKIPGLNDGQVDMMSTAEGTHE